MNLFGQFARTLSTLLENGVPVLTALKITEQVLPNRVIKEATAKTREAVTDGKTLAQPLAQSKVFPQLMVDLVRIGEETGNVPGALKNVADTYENELNIALRVMTNMIEPVMIVAMAGGVGFLLLSVLSAMFSMIANVGGYNEPVRSAMQSQPFARGGFTLIEIMIVVGIMGIVMTMGVPLVYNVFRKAPFTKAITDIVEVCSHARARAILQGLSGGCVPPDGGPIGSGWGRRRPSPEAGAAAGAATVSASNSGSGTSAHRWIMSPSKCSILISSNRIQSSMKPPACPLLSEWHVRRTDDDPALRQGERRKSSLEVTTGLATVGDVKE